MEKMKKYTNTLVSNIKNYTKNNYKKIFIFIFLIFFIFCIYQIYLFYNNSKILKTSIKYNNLQNLDSNNTFYAELKKISQENNFYGLISSLDIINVELNEENYEEAYENYLILLNKNNIDNIYKTLLAIHASYNLLNKLDSDKINNLLTYIDQNIESFYGYYLEIKYLLSLSNQNFEDSNNIFNEIVSNNTISESIKERVRKINVYESNY